LLTNATVIDGAIGFVSEHQEKNKDKPKAPLSSLSSGSIAAKKKMMILKNQTIMMVLN
jgi:hypothetical protein